MCFPVNIAQFLRTAFDIEHLWLLHLNVLQKVCLLMGSYLYITLGLLLTYTFISSAEKQELHYKF